LSVERLAEVSGAMSLPCQQYKIPGKHDTRHQCRQHSTPNIGPPHESQKKIKKITSTRLSVYPALTAGLGHKDVYDGGFF